MPIEIRELNVTVQVNQNAQQQQPERTSPVGGHPMPDKETLKAEIMEDVMTMLHQKEER